VWRRPVNAARIARQRARVGSRRGAGVAASARGIAAGRGRGDSPGARALVNESGPEARRRGPTSKPREDLALPLVHEASLAGIVVVVAHQVQEPVQQEQVDLQGHGDKVEFKNIKAKEL